AHELYTKKEVKTSFVYNDGWKKMCAQNGLFVHLSEPDGLRTVLAMADSGSGTFESDQIKFIRRLLPHIRQFTLMRQTLTLADAMASSLMGLLNNNSIGVMYLDYSGSVLEANDLALELLRREDCLCEFDGILTAKLPADRSRLSRLLKQALPGIQGKVPTAGSMTLQQASSRSRLVLHVSPMIDRIDLGKRRVAMLVLDPSRRVRMARRGGATMLGLTSSEARVAALIAEGLRVSEIAAITDYRENYVRWLIQQIFKKLGLTGQVGLARMVLATCVLPLR
ncbi:MAG: LuxR C-terminal-related transcriptional regulator, partial [Gammaproteobacteria bacterium]|nr:LuxR C-terminal-related transcriptional regulator [Gammaproteobacteria bacterium]